VNPRWRRLPRGERASRAAVLAVVFCAISLSLAYPVREYLTQRRQIDQLQAQHQAIFAQLQRLEAEQQRLRNPSYVEQLARDRLHLCMAGETCYVVIGHRPRPRPAVAAAHPWYERLWQSVRIADRRPAIRRPARQ
jgi:cell division protein FtsB